MKIPVYYIALLLSLLFPPFSSAQDDFCFSLKGSTTCAAFQDYYISLTGLATRYPFLKQVTDIKMFDAGMQSFVTSPLLYLAPLGCTNKAKLASTIPYARYSKTYLCSILIQDSSYSLPCNYERSLNPPPLCQQTCFQYLDSVQGLTNNTDTCPNLVQQETNIAAMNSSCLNWSGLNGTDDCMIGLANEPDNCGFLDVSDACSYCHTNSADNCCRSINCPTISIGAIIGISLGSLAFLSMICAVLFIYHKRKPKKNKNAAESSVFGYESLVSQGILTKPHSQPPPPKIQTQQYQQPIEEFYEVKHPYPPQMGDELGLHLGDIVCVAMNFDDGWALGFNVTTGLKGVFPAVCVAPAPEELLEQLIEDSNKVQIEENYYSVDSPISPTLHTPFFEQETFEMQRNNNTKET